MFSRWLFALVPTQQSLLAAMGKTTLMLRPFAGTAMEADPRELSGLNSSVGIRGDARQVTGNIASDLGILGVDYGAVHRVVGDESHQCHVSGLES
jgi:hypothetical protein